MKTNKITIFIAAATLVVGLLAGWLIFGGSSSEKNHEGHDHAIEAPGEAETWTCSMHPQIRQPEPGDCPICGMDLIPLEDEQDEGIDPMAISMSETAMKLASVRTAKAGTAEPAKTLWLNGKVETDERRIASQSSHIPGRIEKLMVNFTGEFVQQGQKIASVYSPNLVTAQEELFEAEKIKDSQPQLFRAAKEKLKNWKLTEDQVEQILQSGIPQEKFDILADISGYVISRKVNLGDYVNRGQTIYEVADLSRVWVLFDVYEQDMPWIKKGDKISFTIQSVPGETFEGTISYLDPVIDSRTRVAKARVEMANSGLKLKPEMFASGTVEAKLPARAGNLTVPKTAVMWTGKRSLVYVKSATENGVNFIMREVTLGPALGDNYLVESGLEDGEEIAVSGTFSIDAAAQLAGKPSMMMRPETKTMEAPQAFREQITRVANAYFEVKNALVNDDAEKAREAAGKTTDILKKVDMGLLEGDAHHHWMALQKHLKEATEMISATDDIEKQREHFNILSENILEMTESFGLEIEKVYRQFCPMAFDDKGAFWLSESDEVLNPYFGDMMLRCGEVKETYRKGQPVYKNEGAENMQTTGAHNH
ncbi:efflux RND transporter periplasmic adaptor subunit [Mariniphaga sediminis]|uniref:efflux RND transporter periplasmic adaptor subunit n=1 Tax=Mariniphaga sediminis TaxID=1628158 RepID=UPI0035675776